MSIISGKDIEIPFTLSGTADASEYSVSDSPLKIPSGSSLEQLLFQLMAKDDSEVEIIESIILTYGNLVNASTTATSNTINLISDDVPDLSSVEVDKSEIYEHEKR